MRNISENFSAHLKSGATTVCRCWKIIRNDGAALGFSDHDTTLRFDGVDFEASSGLDSTALKTATGLSVDNTEAIGALSSEGISEADITAGKFDDAEIFIWIVNWQNPTDRYLQFRGNIGEITYSTNSFTAELRGLSERLSKPLGRSFSKQCTAILGDDQCQFNLGSANFTRNNTILRTDGQTTLFLEEMSELADDWFVFGQLVFGEGPNAGSKAKIIGDKSVNGERKIHILDEMPFPISDGESVGLIAGCDKQVATCSKKFQNIINFQGFPDIPGEDWMMSVPKSSNSKPL